MAAVTSTSPGTDTASISAPTPERKGSLDALFAESFGEEAAFAGESQSHTADEIKGITESHSSASGKPTSASLAAIGLGAKTGTSATAKIQNLPMTGRPLVQEGVGKTAASTGSRTNSNAVGGASHGAETDPDATSKVTDQTSISSSGDGIDKSSLLANGTTDAGTLDDIDEGAEFDSEIPSVAEGAAVKTGDVKLMSPGQSEIPIEDKSQQTTLTRKAAEDRSYLAKTEKALKTAGKTEGKTAIDAGAVGTQTQTAVCAWAPVSSTAVQQQKLGTVADVDALSPVISAPSGKNAGISLTATNKNSKVINTKKADEEKTKTSGPSATEDISSQKPEIDALKTSLGTAGNQDGDKGKAQSASALDVDTGQLHATAGISGLVSGDLSGKASVHNAGTNPHMTEAISHAVATTQSGANSIDTPISGDTAHKTLEVTPTSIEVGVASGTRGWLKIRAEMTDGGVVNTSLSTSSPAGQEMLHRELPSLTAFLQSEHVAVNAVVVQPTIANAAGSMNSFAGSGGGHEQSQESNAQGRESRQDQASASASHAKTSMLYSGAVDTGGEDVFSSTPYAGGGNWLSVRA